MEKVIRFLRAGAALRRLAFAALAFFAMEASGFSLYDLTCDYERNPIGVDSQARAFSWKLYSDARGCMQSAYQVVVADSPEALDSDLGNMWDSGRRQSSQSLLVPYEGKPLQSATKYYWKARAWDADGNLSAWSQPQTFAMGLLDEADWARAEWIALEADRNSQTAFLSPYGQVVTDYGTPIAQCPEITAEAGPNHLTARIPSGNYYFVCER